MGFSLDYAAEELEAKAAGFTVPDIKAVQGIAEFEELLLVFEQACNELRAEGALGGHVPVLILDHANRPKPEKTEDPKASLIYSLVEIGHRIANQRSASWAAVTSDLQQEHDAWTMAGGRDSLKPIRVPPFSVAEAHELLAQRIFCLVNPNPKALPTEEQLQCIKENYATTLKFICIAAGTRARWLMRLLQVKPASDAELASEGLVMDPTFFSFLPADLRSSNVRVDPQVWREFTDLVAERKDALEPLLAVPHDFALPPSPLAEPGAQHLAKRVLSVDAALRDLLKAAHGIGTVVGKPLPAAKGIPIGLPFGTLADKYFRGHDSDLRQLCAKHVLFYNHGARTLEFESGLMQRIAASLLAEVRHQHGVKLLNKLLKWQEAVMAERVYDSRVKAAGMSAASKPSLQLSETVKQLDLEIEVLRKLLCLLPLD